MRQQVTIDWKPTRKQLGEFADDYYEEFGEALKYITDRVTAMARDEAPVLTGALRSSIRDSILRTGARVMVGYRARVPYGPPAHWGHTGPQDPNDWFLFRQVYPQATKDASGPVAPWIIEKMQEFVNKAIDDFNKKGII